MTQAGEKPESRRATRAERLLRLAFFVAFVTFLAGAFVLGGDALNGRVVNGLYYPGMHGHLTRVSHATYVYSLVHELGCFLLLLAFFAVRFDARDPRPGKADEGQGA